MRSLKWIGLGVNMNLIYALKTGRDIRRPIAKHLGSEGNGWLGRDYVIQILTTPTTSLAHDYNYQPKLIDEEDLLAGDWETREQVYQINISITEPQLNEVLFDNGINKFIAKSVLEELKKYGTISSS